MKLETNCRFCFKLFTYDIGKQKGHFCSKNCANIYRRKKLNVSCAFCGKEILKKPCDVKRQKNSFCSQKCFWEFNKGANVYNFKGGAISQGYRVLIVNSKRIFEHRYVIEQFLGRKLLDSEIVHHINGDKLDNRIENLQITIRKEHIDLHRLTQWSVKHGQCIKCETTTIEHEGKGLCKKCYKQPKKNWKMREKWSLKYESCLDCGETTSRHEGHGFCSRCTQKKNKV